MSRDVLDPSYFKHAPKLTVAEAVTLGLALVEGGGEDDAPAVLRARRTLASRVAELQEAWARRGQQEGRAPATDPREVDREADRTWRALHARLSALAALPAERYPRAARAEALLRSLFGTGELEFLTRPFAEQFAAMEVLLDRIAAEDLAGEVDDLAGPELLVHLHDVQRRYGAMVKGALQRMDEAPENLAERVRVVQRAVADYALQVRAAVDERAPSRSPGRSRRSPPSRTRARPRRDGGRRARAARPRARTEPGRGRRGVPVSRLGFLPTCKPGISRRDRRAPPGYRQSSWTTFFSIPPTTPVLPYSPSAAASRSR